MLEKKDNDMKVETAQVIRSFAPGVLNVHFDGLFHIKDDEISSPGTAKHTDISPSTKRFQASFKGSAETQREYQIYMNEREGRNPYGVTTLNLQGHGESSVAQDTESYHENVDFLKKRSPKAKKNLNIR